MNTAKMQHDKHSHLLWQEIWFTGAELKIAKSFYVKTCRNPYFLQNTEDNYTENLKQIVLVSIYTLYNKFRYYGILKIIWSDSPTMLQRIKFTTVPIVFTKV